MKRIWFIPELIEKLRSQTPPRCTYRKTRKQGLYRVVRGSWHRPQDTGIIIHIDGNEPVNPRALTDEDAQQAGIDTAQELHRLFRRWYGGLPEKMFRNQIVEVTLDGDVHE